MRINIIVKNIFESEYKMYFLREYKFIKFFFG